MSWYNELSRTPRSQIDWDAVKQQSTELNTNRDLNTIVANVPKYTAVKEGQQHPTGKRGQLKLFHEHVWPKGYTPQRLNDVSAATAGFVNDEVGTVHSAHLQNKIVETMARSTVPTQTLGDLSTHSAINITNQTNTGEFDTDTTEIKIHPSVLGKQNSPTGDTSGTVASQVTMHELGHLNDYLSDPDDFWKQESNRAPYSGSDYPSPALEGRAEGFRLATTRITRGMRRGNEARMRPSVGYTSGGFKGTARSLFNVNRVKSFRHASGLDPLPQISETPRKETNYEQPTLPGMKRYMNE